MREKITVYEKPTCSKCREASRVFRESGIEVEKINYFDTPLTTAKLRDLIAKMNMTPRALLRTNESTYRELRLGERDLPDEEIIALMIEHPELMQRPIVERGNRAVLGRPIENIETMMSDE